MNMKFGSLFTGVGGFDLAFERAGMKCKWQCEIDAAASSVLARHWPGIPNIGDVKNVTKDTAEPVDLICGGFPCQDLSVAGRRAGLAGERSGLWFEFARVIYELEPRWVVIENVPGLLSSDKGRDFAIIIRWLAERGYGVAWRVLDSQYFGVAQRRKRVFIVASFGNGRAGQVLFEREGGCWNTAPSREAGQGVAGYSPRGFGEYRETNGTLRGNGGDLGGGSEILIAKTITAKGGTGRNDPSSETFVAYNIQQNDGGDHKRKDRPNGGMYVSETDTALTVGSSDQTLMAWHNKQSAGEIRVQDNISPTISKTWGTGGNNTLTVGVRRLTPTECERLQGFPDEWTAGQSDSARYRQMGNAVTVNVLEWIGKRIMEAMK